MPLQVYSYIVILGIAAKSCGGRTIHSAFGLRPNGNKSKLSDELSQLLEPVVLLIIDEISTVSKDLLGEVHEIFQTVKANSQPLGGISFLFIGDFLQLPPTGNSHIFAPPRPNDSKYSVEGYKIWKLINKVVFLTESMRFKQDPLYASIMDRLRFGNTTLDDIHMLNTRVLSPTTQFPQSYIPCLSISNSLKDAINMTSLLAHAARSDTEIFSFDAILSPATKSSLLSASKLKFIRNLPANKTGGLPATSIIFKGMYVTCTKNIKESEGILVNGLLARIEEIRFESSVSYTSILANENTLIKHADRPPYEIVLRMLPNDKNHSKLLYESYKPGCYPIRITDRTNVYIRLKKKDGFAVMMQTIPIIPAYAITVDKSQGLTLPKMLLGPLNHPSRRSYPSQLLYVALSRTVSLSNLFLTEPLSLNDIKKPPKSILNEIERLKRIE